MDSHLVARSRIPLVEAQVDAVVNATNNDLAEGAGACGAILRAAGSTKLTAACRSLGGCATGQVQVTSAFKLPAKMIIHAVGPRGSDRPDLLASSYRESLLALTRRGLRSLAYPCISTGDFGFDFM
jgi:O-acetyl-ADP-ribose deacetylase (regulator of RNase III)